MSANRCPGGEEKSEDITPCRWASINRRLSTIQILKGESVSLSDGSITGFLQSSVRIRMRKEKGDLVDNQGSASVGDPCSLNGNRFNAYSIKLAQTLPQTGFQVVNRVADPNEPCST